MSRSHFFRNLSAFYQIKSHKSPICVCYSDCYPWIGGHWPPAMSLIRPYCLLVFLLGALHGPGVAIKLQSIAMSYFLNNEVYLGKTCISIPKSDNSDLSQKSVVPSLKLTFSPLKMDAWNTSLSYWGPGLFSGAMSCFRFLEVND